MKQLNTIHTQDLQDVLMSARFMLCDNKTKTQVDMFRSSFGGLFCDNGAAFLERIQAYEDNKNLVPTVLLDIANEISTRATQ